MTCGLLCSMIPTSVCLSVVRFGCAKTTKRTGVLFGLETRGPLGGEVRGSGRGEFRALYNAATTDRIKILLVLESPESKVFP